ncbi:DNA-binding protein [Castellaniella sp.]|uniref:DNA-binding protein n=1 Tax=Castellaniella sp. TaxID=1955812 RepID=UPI002AFEA226|nr:DNA-binding protein [Castellaniella sp.]
MRPAEFSEESVIQAGVALAAAGRNVTGFALRKEVGGGNASRLKQIWDAHVASKASKQSPEELELPVEVADEVFAASQSLTELVTKLAQRLNHTAVRVAERRAAEVERVAAEGRAQADQELADASQAVEALENALDQAQGQIKDLEEKLARTQAASQAQAVEIAQLQERLAASQAATQLQNEAHLENRKKSGAEVQRLAERVSGLKAERDEARKEAVAAREEAAQLRGRVEALQGLVKK